MGFISMVLELLCIIYKYFLCNFLFIFYKPFKSNNPNLLVPWNITKKNLLIPPKKYFKIHIQYKFQPLVF